MTNIGVAHIEQLGSQENILKEKLHIQDGMSEKGTLFLNGDDPLLRDVVPEGGRKKVLYGLSEGCDYRGEDLHLEEGYPVFTAVHGDEKVQLRLQVMGVHMVQNALAGACIGQLLGLTAEEIKDGIEAMKALPGRGQLLEKSGMTSSTTATTPTPLP